MRMNVRGLALTLGICGLSVGGGLYPVYAQNSGGDDVPPLPSSVFVGEADEGKAESGDPASEVKIPPLNVINAPSEYLDDGASSDLPAAGGREPDAKRSGSAEAGEKMPAAQPSEAEASPAARRDGSAEAAAGKKSVRSAVEEMPPEADAAASVKAAQKSSDVSRQEKQAKRGENRQWRRDPGTHSRQSVRGMQPAENKDRPAVSEPPEQQEAAAENAAAVRAAETEKAEDERPQEKVRRPRGTHDGSSVRGYVPSVHPKAAAAETGKPAVVSVQRRRVLPGQYGEALEGIIAEELRVRK